jgi:hypothetical protein
MDGDSYRLKTSKQKQAAERAKQAEALRRLLSASVRVISFTVRAYTALSAASSN